MARYEKASRAPASSSSSSSPSRAPSTDFPGLIPAAIVARDLHVSTQTLRNWTRQGRFPDTVRIARFAYYRARDINDALSKVFGMDELYPRRLEHAS